MGNRDVLSFHFAHLDLDLLVPDPLLDLGGLELVRQLGLGFLNFSKRKQFKF